MVNLCSKKELSCIILLAFCFMFPLGCGQEAEREEANILTVSAVDVEIGTIEKKASYTGTMHGVQEAMVIAKLPNQVIDVRVKPGDKVSKGQLLILLDSRDVDGQLGAAQAQAEQARAALNNAEKMYNRMNDLYKEGAVSQQQYDQAAMGYDVARASLQQAESAVQAAASQAEYARLTSPINGTVGIVYLSEGDTANPSSPAAVVSQLSTLELAVSVNENDIAYLTEACEVEVVVDAVSSEAFKGIVAEVAPVADLRSKCYPVKIHINNAQRKLKSGMFARVKLPAAHKDDALIIPASAVVEKGVGRMAYLLNDDSTVTEVEVETGIIGEENIEILKGLKAGDKVISKGASLLHDRDIVKIVDGGASE